MVRPVEWTEERIAEAKILYLQLLRAGMTEAQIDEVESVPCWDYRAQWKEDASYSDDVQRARSIGAERLLINAEKVLEDTYQRAVVDSASPQLVSVTDQIIKHARWKAAKFAPKVYGEKLQTEVSGVDGSPVKQELTVKFVE